MGYQNPIIPNSERRNTSDPYILRHGGFYYHCYSNAEGVFLARSETPEGVSRGDLLQIYDCRKKGALPDWFAPELHRIGEKWFVYAAPDYGGWMHTMTALVGEGDDPFCPYENAGPIGGLGGRWCIDGTVLQKDGRLYFVYTDCAHLYISEMKDPLTLTGKETVLTTPTLPFETKVGSVNEGPCVLYRGSKIHILFSANDSRSDDYCLGLLTYGGEGDVLDPAAWHKTPTAVFEKTERIFGPGHCSVTTATVEGREVDLLVYHANLESGSGWYGRHVFLQPFTWDGDVPVLGTPAL